MCNRISAIPRIKHLEGDPKFSVLFRIVIWETFNFLYSQRIIDIGYIFINCAIQNVDGLVPVYENGINKRNSLLYSDLIFVE